MSLCCAHSRALYRSELSTPHAAKVCLNNRSYAAKAKMNPESAPNL